MKLSKLFFERNIKQKILILIIFGLIFTGTDLLVKKIVQTNLRVIPKTFEINMFENYILKYDNNDIIKSSYKINNDGNYEIIETNKKKLHLIWKELRKFGFDKEVVVIKNVWSFIYETNEDIGFSVLRFLDKILSPDSKRIFLIFLQGLGVSIILVYFLLSKDKYQFISLALIITGALGNVIDRIMRGYVVDFVKWNFEFIPHRLFNPWPIFNLADVYTVIGAISLFILIMIFDKSSKSN